MAKCVKCRYYALVLRQHETYGCTLNGCDGKLMFEPKERPPEASGGQHVKLVRHRQYSTVSGEKQGRARCGK